MTRKTMIQRLTQMSVALAFALVGPAAAHATSTGGQGPERAAWSPALPAATAVVTVRSTGPVAHSQARGTARRTSEESRVAANRQGGLGWHDAAVGLGILLGVLLLGLWGDVVVGTMIMGVAALFGAGATLVSRKPRRDSTPSGSLRQSGALWPAPGQERR